VLFAGNLQLTGGTIVIEHGYGLKSWYYHMNSIDVKAGDIVAQNQIIGTVGSTGFSTGPHLHFGMSVGSPHSGQFFINPETLITTDLAA
jgi:murein DD-endopeptidase MepM/ murein hydrolase activator NlpD